MNRFYKTVNVTYEEGCYFVSLDGKKIFTPSKQLLKLPTAALADAVAEEWSRQERDIQASKMPLTQLANTAIDHTHLNRSQVIEDVTAYGRTDLLCYQVNSPSDLAEIQFRNWQPLLDWAEMEYGAKLKTTTNLTPIEQSKAALLALHKAVARVDDFTLTGINVATIATGSLILALALLCGYIDAERAYTLAQLDESFQIERWGVDSEAAVVGQKIQKSIALAALFMMLLNEP